jgi:high-affinity iron transporter
MLINALLILLRHSLPLSFLIVFWLLLSTFTHRTRALLLTSSVGVIIVFFQITAFDYLSSLNQGMGSDILYALLNFTIYLCISALIYTSFRPESNHNTQLNKVLWCIAYLAIFSLNIGDISLYLLGLNNEKSISYAAVIGIVLSLGISSSVGILFYFLLRTLFQQNLTYLILIVFLFFGLGQLMTGVNLLIQIDWLPSVQAIWDSSQLIQENSELGYFLTALFGYESRPSWVHIVIYLIALIAPLLIFSLVRISHKNTNLLVRPL